MYYPEQIDKDTTITQYTVYKKKIKIRIGNAD